MSTYSEPKTFMIEDARIMFRNFAGKEGPYNKQGDRNFAVVIPESEVEPLTLIGWNVKFTKPREEGDEPIPYIPVSVSYKIRPPRVVMVTSRSRTNLDEEAIEVLDWANIRKVDLICRANEWNVNGASGLKAYLQTMFVTIEEDALELKYAINEVGETVGD